MNVAISRDGKAWDAALVLESEPGEYSYPAVIQARTAQSTSPTRGNGSASSTSSSIRPGCTSVPMAGRRVAAERTGVERGADRRPWDVPSCIGTLTVGILDILDAFIFFGLRGAKPVASCRASRQACSAAPSYQGGMRTAALGLALHFVIAFGVVAVYLIATRIVPALNRRPLGIWIALRHRVYVVMNFVIVPMSHAALGSGPTPLVVRANGVLIHMFGVGLPPPRWWRRDGNRRSADRESADVASPDLRTLCPKIAIRCDRPNRPTIL